MKGKRPKGIKQEKDWCFKHNNSDQKSNCKQVTPILLISVTYVKPHKYYQLETVKPYFATLC